MKDHVLFIGWNRPITGREATASELFNSMVNYFGQQQKKGTVASFEPVLLSVHGGDMNGFMLVRGDVDNLNKIREEDEFLKLVTQCAMNVEGFGVINGWTGDRLQDQMKRWRTYIK